MTAPPLPRAVRVAVAPRVLLVILLVAALSSAGSHAADQGCPAPKPDGVGKNLGGGGPCLAVANATQCATSCCRASDCVGWVFTSFQPDPSGEPTCPQGKSCCWLKTDGTCNGRMAPGFPNQTAGLVPRAPPGGGRRTANTSADQLPNMNGQYVLANDATWPAAPKHSWPTNFKSYPGGVESFDVYHGPITSTYAQVWWTADTNDLPAEIVQRFDGKVMAMVGVEMDQVRQTAAGEEVSVPINVAYNHHHGVLIRGKGARMETMDAVEAEVAGLRGLKLSEKGKVWVAVEHTPSTSGAPTFAVFDDGNGGEFRKTYHGYAFPFAQLVESPAVLAGVAMQIDTWERYDPA